MQNSSSTCWAPFGDAIKLILTGATDETLSADKNAIYLNMLDQGMRDEAGNKSEERYLPGVQTEQYCVDEENGKYETVYFIPDLFRFMLTLFKDWSILNPPVNLDYLNSLTDELDNPFFMFSNAPGYKQWEESEEGKEYWELIYKKDDIERKLVELEITHHGNDPLKLEAQKRMRDTLNDDLMEVNTELENFEGSKAKNLTHMREEESPAERKQRLDSWYQEECRLRGESGAIRRTAEREGIKRQTLSDILKRNN